MKSGNWAFFVIIFFLVFPAVAQDKSTYYTVTHPDEFHMDWKGFYDNADQWTAVAREKLPTHLVLRNVTLPKHNVKINKKQPED